MAQKSIHTDAYGIFRGQLVAARHKAGLTQQQLADKLKRPQSFVAKYEGGERRVDLIELLEIAAILGLDVNKLTTILRRSL
jgi:transcriptional regulator with XRE-family HTH domain